MRGVMLILADLILENFIRVVLLNCQHLSLTLQSTRLLLVLMSAGFCPVFRGSGSESQGQSGAEWSDINTVGKLIKMQPNVIIAVGVQHLTEAGRKLALGLNYSDCAEQRGVQIVQKEQS